MAVFGKWKKYFLVVLMLVLCYSHSQTAARSGRYCYQFQGTYSFICERCNFLEEETLDCSNESLNFIKVIGSNQVVGLDVSHNQLSTTPVIHGCPDLVWIDLSYNNLRVVNEQTFKNIGSRSLKLINLNNCGVLMFLPPPFKDIFPKLEIFLIANNSFVLLNMSFLQKLENFMLLDIRGNEVQQPTSVCNMMTQNVTILLELANCDVSWDDFCHKYNLTYPLSFCLEDGQSKFPQTSLPSCTTEGRAMSTHVTTITNSTSIIATGTRMSSDSVIVTVSTEESATSLFVTKWLPAVISASCAGFLVLIFLLLYQIRSCWKRKRRQNQYNRWLAVYTPPQYVCTFQKRVSFSGEIVIKQSGENNTKKKLNSDESKKSCSRQFDFNLLIRTQSLPLQMEEEGGKPSRVLSWI